MGEGGTVLTGKGGFFLSDIKEFKIKDWVEWPGFDGSIHILSV